MTLRHRAACALAFAALYSTLGGCAPPMASRTPKAFGVAGSPQSRMVDINGMMQKNKLMQEMMSNPDLPAWHDQREQMALAVGDRTIDKSFDRTFDSMIIALANLGCRVTNMERVSGYITASLPQLPPDQQQALHKEAIQQYALAKGYPASVLESHGPYDTVSSDYGANMMERMGAGLTLTMAKQSGAQTKVKIRFDNVYYPRTVQELYKRVWDAVDKQIFLDKAIG